MVALAHEVLAFLAHGRAGYRLVSVDHESGGLSRGVGVDGRDAPVVFVSYGRGDFTEIHAQAFSLRSLEEDEYLSAAVVATCDRGKADEY
jgi:hypothetical protein